jgi:hypothetical protein
VSEGARDILTGAVIWVIMLAVIFGFYFGVTLPHRANSAFDACVDKSGVVKVVDGEVQCSYVHTVVKP